LFSCLFVTSCNESNYQPVSPLNGNWHIAGTAFFQPYPLLTLALIVSGNTVYGNGDVGVNCSSGGWGIGGSLGVKGQIAADGTFLLTNAFSGDSIHVAIQGKVPAEGSESWAGSFTITNSASQTLCTFDVSSDFVATAYPPLDGRYDGTLAGQSLGSGITAATQITQSAGTSFPRRSPLAPIYYIPLSATIAVSGSPCFTSGKTSNAPLNSIGGNTFELNYTMNDGSTLLVNGSFSDPSESSLQLDVATVIGGKCNGAYYSGTLTRQ
jgi:hypothetical protein